MFRNELLELIQYAPQTDEVYEVPVLVVPPTINKFYAIDLAPERSLVEHGVRQGRQMFVISWRNPDSRHASWNLDTYVRAVLDALDAVEEITGSDADGARWSVRRRHPREHDSGVPRRHRPAGPAGRALPGGHRHRQPRRRDRRPPSSTNGWRAWPRRSPHARATSTAGTLAEVFAWLRPGDLVWNYWVNNYLLGKRPPAFDILFWNSDTTRMTAALHADFVDLAMRTR